MRVVAAGLMLAATVAVGGPGAAGDQPSAELGLRPALTGRTTLDGGHFSYALPAGAHADDAVDAVNFSPGPLTVDLYPANLGTTAQGALAPGQPGAPPTGATAWLTMREATLDLGPRSESEDRFALDIPRGTPPGDYLAAIVGARAGGPIVSGDLVVQSRVALIVRVTVLGRSDPRVSLGHLRAHRAGSTETLSLTVTNSGNTLLGLAGTVAVHAPSHRIDVALGPADMYVIPGGRATLTGTWHGLPALGRAGLDASVTASVNDKPIGTYPAAPLSLLFVPWTQGATAAAGLGAVALTLVVTRKRRTAWRARRAAERRVLADYRASQQRQPGS